MPHTLPVMIEVKTEKFAVSADEDFDEEEEEEQEDDDLLDEDDDDDDLEAPEAVPLIEPLAERPRKAQRKASIYHPHCRIFQLSETCPMPMCHPI